MSQENLFKALEMFGKGVKEQQQTQSLVQASEFADQIRRSQLDEAGKRQQLRQVADQLTLALSGQGKTAPEIQQVANAISPGLAFEGDIAKIQAQGRNQMALKAVDVAQTNSEKAVPGFGVATQKGIAKDLIEFNADRMKATESIDELQAIIGKPLKSISPEMKAKATTISKMLGAALRKEIIGTGAMSDTEQKVLADITRNPTAMFSFDDSNKAALMTLRQKVNAGFASKLEAAGIKAPDTLRGGSSSSPSSSKPAGNSLDKYIFKRK